MSKSLKNLRGLLPGGYVRGERLSLDRLGDALADAINRIDRRARCVAEDAGLPDPAPRFGQILADLHALLTGGTTGARKAEVAADLLHGEVTGTTLTIGGVTHDIDWVVMREVTDPTIIVEDGTVIYLRSWADHRAALLKLGADHVPGR